MQYLGPDEELNFILHKILTILPLQERLEGLSVEERLQGLSDEELLQGLIPERREHLRQLLDQTQPAQDNSSPQKNLDGLNFVSP